MIPRSQHFGDRASFPVNWSGIVRIFEKPRLEALLLTAGGRAHYPGEQSNASVEDRHRAKLAAREDIVADRDGFDVARLEDALVETLEAAAEQDNPLACRQIADAPRGVSASIGRPSATLSIAAARTSGLSTIPAPPPAGVSSTLRCLSVAKSRMWTVSSDQVPSSSARPARLTPSGPGNISGYSVRTVERNGMAAD
jgi:hypothetical protein